VLAARIDRRMLKKVFGIAHLILRLAIGVGVGLIVSLVQSLVTQNCPSPLVALGVKLRMRHTGVSSVAPFRRQGGAGSAAGRHSRYAPEEALLSTCYANELARNLLVL